MLARHETALALVLPSDREILLTGVFNAPRSLVFEAWTRPEHVRKWYGSGRLALTACEIDLAAGGAYRYAMRSADGAEHTMQGIYREIAPPGRLVYTEQYVGPGFTSSEAVVTLLLAEHAGMTTLTATVLHHSKADRDAHLGSGMEKGAGAALDRLARHLATM